MDDAPKSIRYRGRDFESLSIEELSLHARVSQAFIRLCIENGCPAPGGRLSQSRLLEWLAFNYAEVRAASGLKPVAPINDVADPARRALQLTNSLITLLEFSESRSSRRSEKSELRKLRRLVEKTV